MFISINHYWHLHQQYTKYNDTEIQFNFVFISKTDLNKRRTKFFHGAVHHLCELFRLFYFNALNIGLKGRFP